SGYYEYSNPYYEEVPPLAVAEAVPAYDYSQPITLTNFVPVSVEASQPVEGAAAAPAPPEQPPNPPQVQAGLKVVHPAPAASLQGNYKEALKLTDQAQRAAPGDPVLHEFRALVQFALKDYHQAAATLNALLAVAPGWDWTTMIGLYPS